MSRIVAFTGAGISKASGLPTFAEMGDLRQKLSRAYFRAHPAEFYAILGQLGAAAHSARPSQAHLALAQHGVDIVTMNIDGLHQKAGSQRVLEIHGNMDYVVCQACRRQYPFPRVPASIYCPTCQAILEPNIVLYGDSTRRYFEAIDSIGGAERLLVVGTSYYTSTAKDLVGRARMAGIPVTEINSNADKLVPQYLAEHSQK